MGGGRERMERRKEISLPRQEKGGDWGWAELVS